MTIEKSGSFPECAVRRLREAVPPVNANIGVVCIYQDAIGEKNQFSKGCKVPLARMTPEGVVALSENGGISGFCPALKELIPGEAMTYKQVLQTDFNRNK